MQKRNISSVQKHIFSYRCGCVAVSFNSYAVFQLSGFAVFVILIYTLRSHLGNNWMEVGGAIWRTFSR